MRTEKVCKLCKNCQHKIECFFGLLPIDELKKYNSTPFPTSVKHYCIIIKKNYAIVKKNCLQRKNVLPLFAHPMWFYAFVAVRRCSSLFVHLNFNLMHLMHLIRTHGLGSRRRSSSVFRMLHLVNTYCIHIRHIRHIHIHWKSIWSTIIPFFSCC